MESSTAVLCVSSLFLIFVFVLLNYSPDIYHTISSFPSTKLTFTHSVFGLKNEMKRIESSKLVKLAADVEFVGCVGVDDGNPVLKADPVDCTLFCLGRFYSFVNVNQLSRLCFCSKSTHTQITGCSKDTFDRYELRPKKYPNSVVRGFA